jgi:hypothetical protein
VSVKVLFARVTDHEWSLTLEVRKQSSEGVVMKAGESTPENTDGQRTNHPRTTKTKQYERSRETYMNDVPRDHSGGRRGTRTPDFILVRDAL